VISSMLLSVATAPHFCPHLLTEELPQIFAQPITVKLFSRPEEKSQNGVCGDLPHPLSLWSNLGFCAYPCRKGQFRSHQGISANSALAKGFQSSKRQSVKMLWIIRIVTCGP
jgi:hypothetical protein